MYHKHAVKNKKGAKLERVRVSRNCRVYFKKFEAMTNLIQAIQWYGRLSLHFISSVYNILYGSSCTSSTLNSSLHHHLQQSLVCPINSALKPLISHSIQHFLMLSFYVSTLFVTSSDNPTSQCQVLATLLTVQFLQPYTAIIHTELFKNLFPICRLDAISSKYSVFPSKH